MKKHHISSKITYLLLWFWVSILLSSPGFAQDISVATRLSQIKHTVESEFELDVTVALQNVLTIGGTIYLQYDPAVFECIQVSASGFLGAARTQACEQVRPGVLRIETTVESFAGATTSDAEETLATVTFRVKAEAENAALQLQPITQLFGSGMGNIVSILDDSATQQITTYTPLIVSINLPPSGATLSETYSFEWLIENTISAPMALSLEFSPDRGQTWNMITNTVIETSGAYEWDTTPLTPGSDYIIRASVLNEYEDFQMTSGPVLVTKEIELPEGVPEPTTLFLFGLGILLLFSIKRNFLPGRK